MPILPPFMVSYSITRKCNLKCKHCYSDSVDQAERLLARGKEVMVRIHSDGDKTSYTLEVDGPDNDGED